LGVAAWAGVAAPEPITTIAGIAVLVLLAVNGGEIYLASAGIYLTEAGDDTQAADTKPQSPSLKDVYKTPPLDQYPAGWDGTTPPAEGWEWKGQPGSKPGDPEGNWWDPVNEQYLRKPSAADASFHGDHIDWRVGRKGKGVRWRPDGTIEHKK
jgi:hypothetical protein